MQPQGKSLQTENVFIVGLIYSEMWADVNLCHFAEELLLQIPAPQTASAIQGKDFYAAPSALRGFVNAEMFLTKYHIAWYCYMGGKKSDV